MLRETLHWWKYYEEKEKEEKEISSEARLNKFCFEIMSTGIEVIYGLNISTLVLYLEVSHANCTAVWFFSHATSRDNITHNENMTHTLQHLGHWLLLSVSSQITMKAEVLSVKKNWKITPGQEKAILELNYTSRKPLIQFMKTHIH